MTGVKVTESSMAVSSNGTEVTTFLVEPDDAVALMVLGHGSGTPAHYPLMVEMAEALADQRIATFRYNFPYSEGMTSYDPNEIDTLDVLLATTRTARAAAGSLSLDLPLFFGGRSMSSQVVSLAMSQEHWSDIHGVALYVFPMRWQVLLEDTVGHLPQVPAPMLFVQGGRDEEYANVQELQTVLDNLDGRASLHVVEGADHDYDLPPESGRTRSDALKEVAAVTAKWVQNTLR
ncbi:MAG: hypothetical protein J4G14_15115 [Dehalococcoidia bacterium]|nr:hypothetical protein [Dehalococcoidia bacterium]